MLLQHAQEGIKGANGVVRRQQETAADLCSCCCHCVLLHLPPSSLTSGPIQLATMRQSSPCATHADMDKCMSMLGFPRIWSTHHVTDASRRLLNMPQHFSSPGGPPASPCSTRICRARLHRSRQLLSALLELNEE